MNVYELCERMCFVSVSCEHVCECVCVSIFTVVSIHLRGLGYKMMFFFASQQVLLGLPF